MSEDRYRLITRSDFDGLACAALLRELDLIDEIKFVHPKDMQDGNILVSDRDITANLPYVKGVYIAFDHHLSETIRLEEIPHNYVIDAKAPSAARIVYEHFGAKERFPGISEEMMEAVDKADSAQFTKEEILHPEGWVLLNFLMDPRTGLGQHKNFRISNYDLMMSLIEHCRNHPVDEILALPDVKERVELYWKHHDDFKSQIRRCIKVQRNLGVLDMRGEQDVYVGNRFIVYALYPEINISAQVLWGLNRLNTVIAVGKSVLNRTSKTNVGELMLAYGGGGHEAAGTCQVANEDAEGVLAELIEKINADG